MASQTTRSVVDVLDRVIGLPPKEVEDGAVGNGAGNHATKRPPKPFLPSKKWEGAKAGYVFRTSARGTGYHLDEANDGGAAASAAAAESSTGAVEGNDEAAARHSKKRARFDSSRDTTHVIPPRAKARTGPLPTGDELLAEAEEAASERPHAAKVIELTPRGVRAASTGLDRTLRRNQLLRAQHADDPERFMMNELALNDEIVSFQSVAVNVGLYGELVDCGAVNSFVTLLNHENADVAISVLNLMVELLDPDLLVGGKEGEKEGEALDPAESARNMGLLANAFLDGGGLELLSSNLGRFDESVEEDAKGVEDALTLAESLLDLDRAGVLRGAKSNEDGGGSPSVVECVCEQTTFLSWLFQRIEKEEEEASATTAPISPAVVKLHASEVLSAVLQHEDYSTRSCGSKLTALPKYKSAFDDDPDEKPPAKNDGEENEQNTIDGMEVLLLAIAGFRKSDPQIEVECEFLENAFDALAAALLRGDNVADFVDAEGIELMLRCLRQRVHAGGGALKVLNFALSGSAGDGVGGDDVAYREACESFVGAGGIKLLFPLYMGRRSAMPRPAACSEGGSDLAKKGKQNDGGYVSKRAKRAAHARRRWLAEAERNAVDIVYSLTRHIAKDSEHDAYARLLVKFVEEDCVGVHARYHSARVPLRFPPYFCSPPTTPGKM